MILIGIEEVHLFLLANPDKECTSANPKLIIYALIKLTKTGVMYAKVIEKRKKRSPKDWQKWAKLSAHIVEYYEIPLT